VPEAAIRTEALVKDYGTARGLDGLDLEVFTGEVFGFLGPNGAGKTTAIRLFVDLIRPTSGSATVLGLEPRSEGVELRRRLGYLPGDFVVDGHQTGREILTYLANLRGGVAVTRIDDLAERLGLDTTREVKTLSRGNRQKIGVIQAFMHEPELLVLDEPTSGLDPFLQAEFVAMARAVAAEGRTVFMSSHVMSEVQRCADRVGVIRAGRLVTVESIHELGQRSARHLEVLFAEPVRADDFAGISGLRDVAVVGSRLTCRLDGPADELLKAIAAHPVITITAEEPDLTDVFFESYGTGRNDAG
jgi:ABC-2 type transport system ATP-binding protein